MTEFLAALIENPVIRGFIESLVLDIVSKVFASKGADPEFLKKSQAAFVALSSAKTDDERTNAQKLLRDLMSAG